MRVNTPVINDEKVLEDNELLVTETDAKGVITNVNQAFVDISGFTKDELIGQAHNIIRHPDMPPEVFDDLWKTLTLKKTWTGLVKNRCKDGSFYWVNANVTPIIEEKKIIGYLSLRSKTTREQVQVAEALYSDMRDGQAKFKLVNGNLVKKGLKGVIQHKLSYISIRARIICLPIIAVLGLLILSSFGLYGSNQSSDDLHTIFENQVDTMSNLNDIRGSLQLSRINALVASSFNNTEVSKKRTMMTTAHDKGMREKWARYEAGIATPEEKKQAALFIQQWDAYNKSRDITLSHARKGNFIAAADNATHNAEPKFDAAHATIIELIRLQSKVSEYDYNSAVTSFKQNRNLIMIVVGGITVSLIAFLGLLLLHAVIQPLSRAKTALSNIAAGNYTSQIRVVNHDEIGEFVEAIKSMQTRAGNAFSESKALVIDMEKMRNNADNANRAKSEFLAMMSHEIRTPMNGVIGMLDILSQTSLSNHQLEMVALSKDSADMLLDIIDDILDFSKIEAGKLNIENEAIFIEGTVEKVCSILKPVGNKKGVALTLFVDPGVPRLAQGDVLRLRQILSNLINNAIKFSSDLKQSGLVAVRVKLIKQEDEVAWVEFVVSDNGIGINEETQGRLFSPFQQAESSTTRRFGGTGLGLVISRKLIEMQGGNISLISAEGLGSTFTVQLPFTILQSSETKLSSPILGLPCLMMGPNADLLADVAYHLTHAGAAVHFAENIDAVHTHIFDQPIEILTAWVLDTHGDKPLSLDALRVAAHKNLCKNVRLIVITHGNRRHPRLDKDGVVNVDSDFLTNERILETVSIAIGSEEEEKEEQSRSEATLYKFNETISQEVAIDQGKLVLVAEDNITNQKVIRQQLSLLGLAIEMASDGQQAFNIWQARPGDFSLLITDIHMPNMDGYELAAAIRTAETQAGNKEYLTIIALTASALAGENDRCKAAGMDDYLTKPVRLENFKDKFKKWLPSMQTADEERVKELNSGRKNIPSAKVKVLPVDKNILTEQVGGDPAVVAELLRDFRDNAAKITVELQIAYESAQYDQISVLAHKLKSSARFVGALKLGEICEQIEYIRENEGMENLNELFSSYKNEWTLVDSYLAE